MNSSKKHYNFLKRLLIFAFLSSFLFFVIFEFSFYRLGEIGNYAEIINQQKINDILFGPKLRQKATLDYKIKGTVIIKPDILILGTSTIMQINQKHFSHNKIYNAGVNASASQGLEGMIKLLNSIPKNDLPKHIIVGLDPWIFNPNYPENSNNKTIRELVKNALKNKPLIFNTVKLIVNSPRDLIRRLSSYSSLINQKTPWIHYLFSSPGFKGFGLNAKMLEIGYRFDGSYKYPNDYGKEWNDQSIENYKIILEKDAYRFAPASQIYNKSIDDLKNILDFAIKNNIYITGLLPPFSPNFYSALTSMSDRSKFYQEYENKICSIFQSYGFQCFNFCDIQNNTIIKKYNNDFYDNMHPGEGLMGEITKQIMSSANLLNAQK